MDLRMLILGPFEHGRQKGHDDEARDDHRNDIHGVDYEE
jgi:hypothetical protein